MNTEERVEVTPLDTAAAMLFAAEIHCDATDDKEEQLNGLKRLLMENVRSLATEAKCVVVQLNDMRMVWEYPEPDADDVDGYLDDLPRFRDLVEHEMASNPNTSLGEAMAAYLYLFLAEVESRVCSNFLRFMYDELPGLWFVRSIKGEGDDDIHSNAFWDKPSTPFIH